MHVSLYVSDLSKTIDFYTHFFEQSPTKVKPGYAKYTLDKPSLIISFVENKERVQQNFGHLGFQVETIEEMYRRMFTAKVNGIQILEEMGTNCCYAKQDKFWVTDPDGVQWEVYFFHEDAEFNDPHYEMGGNSRENACCSPNTKYEVQSTKYEVQSTLRNSYL